MPQVQTQANLPQVLVLENDPQTQAYTRDALLTAGFAALLAGNPDEAYRLLEDERPQAVLLDLMIPGMEGTGCHRTHTESGRHSRDLSLGPRQGTGCGKGV